MTNEITYLFGAGASCQSMPMVHSFCDRFRVYLEFLRNIGAKQSFIDRNKSLINEIKSHLSFDTYFKKLFHQNNPSVSIDQRKYLIYLYFIFEHLFDTTYYTEIGRKMNPSCTKDFGCDPRYDALIAGLLKPSRGKSEFYCKANFLTWNYDLNLSYSLYSFLGQDISFETFMTKSNSALNTFEFGTHVKLFHLNGYIKSNEVPGSLGLIPLNALQDKFQRLIVNSANNDYVQEAVLSLNFSWENIGNDNSIPDFIFEAGRCIESSDSLIIIGYSFPLYNRLFDLELLSEKNLRNKKITIVDPNAIDLKRILHSDFGIHDNADADVQVIYPNTPNIEYTTVKDHFFVPPQLFRL